jgi:hypothetical protein
MSRVWFVLAGLLLAGLVTTVWGQASSSAVLENPGFEVPSIMDGAEPGTAPDKWFYFASTDDSLAGVTDRKKRAGSQSFVFKAQKPEGAFHGLAQKLSASPGQRYEFSLYAVNDAQDPMAGNATCQVSIEWQDEEGKEIERIVGEEWNFDLSAIRWEKFRIQAKAPEGTAYLVAVVTFFSRDADGYGTCYVDDARLVMKRSSD